MNRKDISNIKLPSESNKEAHKSFFHENFIAGIAPNLRGIDATMYIRKPWRIIHPEKNDGNDPKSIVNMDLSPSFVYDSENKTASITFNKEKKTINSVEDFKNFFKDISLDKLFISIPKNEITLPILAFYMITAEEQSVPLDILKGIIKIDTNKEFTINKKTEHSKTIASKISTDIIKYTNTHTPQFNNISIIGYQSQKKETTPETELAYTLLSGINTIKEGIGSDIDIDTLANTISFSWEAGTDHFYEIAKMRASRMLWAKLIKQFNPKNPDALKLRFHSKINTLNTTKQDSFKNLGLSGSKAMSVIFGGTQSLNLNTHHKFIEFTKDFSSMINKKTQLYLLDETNIAKIIDPWAGSYYLEELTEKIAGKTWKLIEEIKKVGDIKKHNQIRHQESNSLASDFKNKTSQLPQKGFINIPIKNKVGIEKSLNDLTNCIKTGKGNLLHYTLVATRNRATIHEIMQALKN